MFAALTGLLYVFSPQIEAWRYAELDRVPIVLPAVSLDKQIQAAQQVMPNRRIKNIIPAYRAGETTQLIFNPESTDQHMGHPGHTEHHPSAASIVYVDPGTAQVRGSLSETARFRDWSRQLHSMLLQTDGWRWLIELGASSLLFLMLSGLYLWWPAEWSVLRFDRQKNATQARYGWRYLHSTAGVLLGVLVMVIVLTGLTWSKFAGEHFRLLQNSLGQNAARIPKTLHSTLPAATAPSNTAVQLSAQAILERAQHIAPAIQLQLTPPQSDDGVWRIDNADRSQPSKRILLALDAYDGRILFQSDWQQLPLLAKATAVGIPFHRGEFGGWNQALLVIVAIAVIFYVVSGYVLWWQRRQLLRAAKQSLPTAGLLAAPVARPAHVKAVPWWLWIVLIGMGYALPVLGGAMCLLLLWELVYFARQTTTLSQS